VSHGILPMENNTTVAEAITDELTHSDDESFEVDWGRCRSEGLGRLAGVEQCC
jgi:hypothetical protein